jgi:hypothetical protein
MPLLVAAGAAGGDEGRVLFAENIMKIPMTSYVFGEIDLLQSETGAATIQPASIGSR